MNFTNPLKKVVSKTLIPAMTTPNCETHSMCSEDFRDDDPHVHFHKHLLASFHQDSGEKISTINTKDSLELRYKILDFKTLPYFLKILL
jgi:hypothetical protein